MSQGKKTVLCLVVFLIVNSICLPIVDIHALDLNLDTVSGRIDIGTKAMHIHDVFKIIIGIMLGAIMSQPAPKPTKQT